jgi:hypothetical protein
MNAPEAVTGTELFPFAIDRFSFFVAARAPLRRGPGPRFDENDKRKNSPGPEPVTR